jgi:hypothetical protein
MKVQGRVISNDTRERLQAARTYYVRTDGNDANTGLANTAGGAFLTLQKAINTYQALDCSIYDVTIQIADGTYAAGIVLTSRVGGGQLNITGNTGTPANVVVSTSATCILIQGHPKGSQINIAGMKLVSSAGNGIQAVLGSFVVIGAMEYGACAAGSHIVVDSGALAVLTVAYKISGGATNHYLVSQGSVMYSGGMTVTLSGTPAFSGVFAASYFSFSTIAGITWSGSATGKRYDASQNGIINTSGQATTWLPGNISGTTATGGQYT